MQDRKITFGIAFMYGTGAVSWISKKQEVVALSSTEVEYIALCSICCQGIWLQRILNDCGVKQEGPIYICCDNKSCIAMAKNPVMHGKTKHIDVKYHFIHKLVAEKAINLNFCGSEEQLADNFTKCLDAREE